MYVLIFSFGVVLGAGAIWFLLNRRLRKMEEEMLRVDEEEGRVPSGFLDYNEQIQERISERKQQIVEAIRKNGTIQRSDVVELLEVSNKTAYNYLEELEQEGIIAQVGDIGRNVRYRLTEVIR